MSHFERLSAQDASFLVYEDMDRHAHMHVGGVSIYEGGGLTNARGGVDVDRLRRYVESRLPQIPRYRQRLAHSPVLGEPVWVDDDRFNVRYHVRHTRLPRPGDERELKRLTGRIMSQRLDRTRPLWELWIVEGLEGARFAIVTKTHHCMIDGVSGVDISTVLMRLDDDASIEEPPPWRPRPAPGSLRLLADEAARRLAAPIAIARDVSAMVGGLRGALRPERLAGAARTAAITWRGPAATPLNQAIGSHRRYDWTDVALEDAKAIKNRLQGTINDVVLTVVAGALGEFLRRRRVNTEILDFIAAIPVNTRAADDRSLGTQVGAWLATLPLSERDPRRRFAAVHEMTTALKASPGSDPAGVLYRGAELGGPPAVGLVVRLMQRLSPANVVVTNVPGPPFPLYMLGARMVAAYPMVTLLAGQGLGIAVFSYMGRLYVGLNADWDMVPDLHELVLALDRGFAALADAAGVGAGGDEQAGAPQAALD